METDGFQETRSYTIAATGKAFRNLMDGLYGRKIEAVVREIATNAYDSHTQAGYPHRAFEVRLPTYLKPHFTVRDYGVGMGHEQVLDRYSTLFESTKDTSNDQVGMLGLGSKSPFAYTDGFTLRCWDGEVRRTYSSYLGDGGVPLISVADISPSAEPTGVEVSFPVKNGDYHAFTDAAKRVFKGFPTIPVGLPAEVTAGLHPVPTRSGDGWALVDFKYLPQTHVVWALQGCVYYPVEAEQLEGELAKKFGYNSYQILLDFPVGELEFTPGRETLSYTPGTVDNINKRFKAFQEAISIDFEDHFSGCTTDWERAVALGKKGITGLYSALFRLSSHYDAITKIETAVSEALPRELRDAYAPQGRLFQCVNVDGEVRRSRYRRSYRNDYPSGPTSRSGAEVLWVERSRGVRNHVKRIAHYMQQNGHVYALNWAEPHPDLFETHEQTLEDWTPDMSLFGNPPVLRTADMPEPPVPPREKGEASNWNRYLAPNSTGRGMNPYVQVEHDALPEDAQFLFMCHDKVVIPQETGQAKLWPVVPNFSYWQYAQHLYMLDMLCGKKVKPPYIVRMKAGETLARWKGLRRHVINNDGYADSMPKKTITDMVNIANHDVIADTHYQSAYLAVQNDLKAWEKLGSRVGTNPISALKRFERRTTHIERERRTTLRSYYEGLTFSERGKIMDLAQSWGLEVLPEKDQYRGLPYDLLPLRWERLARMLAALRNSGGRHAARVDLLIRDALQEDRKGS